MLAFKIEGTIAVLCLLVIVSLGMLVENDQVIEGWLGWLGRLVVLILIFDTAVAVLTCLWSL